MSFKLEKLSWLLRMLSSCLVFHLAHSQMAVAIVIKRMEGFLEVAFPKGSGVPSMGIAATALCPTITPEELAQLLREIDAG